MAKLSRHGGKLRRFLDRLLTPLIYVLIAGYVLGLLAFLALKLIGVLSHS